MGRRYGVAIGLALIALALPAACFANPVKPNPPDEVLPWVFLAETGVVILEVALVRRILKLSYWEALPTVFWANVASILIPGLFSGIFLSHEVLSGINSFLFQTSPVGSGGAYTWLDILSRIAMMIAFWLVVALVIEMPILAIGFRKYRPHHHVLIAAGFINLVSYPLFYLSILVVGWAVNGVQPATNEWGFPV